VLELFNPVRFQDVKLHPAIVEVKYTSLYRQARWVMEVAGGLRMTLSSS
jgi:hypothetical protein